MLEFLFDQLIRLETNGGKKCTVQESNLGHWHYAPKLYQLSYLDDIQPQLVERLARNTYSQGSNPGLDTFQSAGFTPYK